MTGRFFTLPCLVIGALACSDATDPVSNPGPTEPKVQEVTVTAVTPTLVSGVVGTRVEALPAVVVKDLSGRPVANFPVNFIVTRGGGYTDGSTVRSNSLGLAALGYWQLGIRPDTNVVQTRMDGVPPVLFRVAAAAGAPMLRKVSGDDQVVDPGSRVPVPPAVAVVDVYDNPIAGVGVTFSSMNADDAITGTSSVSGLDGKVALDSWTVGALGSHRVTATAAGMTSAVFSVVAIDSPAALCQADRPLSAPSVTATLGAGTCITPAGRPFDTYSMTARAGFQVIRMESTQLDSYLQLFTPDGTPVARNDDADGITKNSLIRIFLPAGTLKLTATSLSGGSPGAYEIRQEGPVAIDRPCDPIFVVKGVNLGGVLDSGACGARAIHRYRIFLPENSTVEADVLTLDYSNLYLNLSNASGSTLVQGEPVPGSYRTRFSYRATSSGYYSIDVSSSDENAGYELTIR